MDFELTLYQLGKILREIDSKYDMTLLNKVKLSGGWMTINGAVSVDYIPEKEGIIGGNNIISLNMSNSSSEGNIIKITGLKDLTFNINLSSAKYRVINKSGINLNQVKEKSDKSTLRIDENMIFTINASVEEVKKYFDLVE